MSGAASVPTCNTIHWFQCWFARAGKALNSDLFFSCQQPFSFCDTSRGQNASYCFPAAPLQDAPLHHSGMSLHDPSMSDSITIPWLTTHLSLQTFLLVLGGQQPHHDRSMVELFWGMNSRRMRIISNRGGAVPGNIRLKKRFTIKPCNNTQRRSRLYSSFIKLWC